MRCFYVMHDCTEAQKAQLREAAGELVCVFADECAPEAREAAFASAEAVLGEPAPESVAQAQKGGAGELAFFAYRKELLPALREALRDRG